ncbi:helix-turn-helix transcriptional regulator [Thermobifida halotolerans]|uniref:Helix-turn-helix transcriptional regulator n=1 Tax=Thermobifida halotolerans TaxID=483545 RepID=A0AA97LZW2_9ACTN|nr:helix-turn-helix transcriptional regulator [Thermobifida halotolerans]UOE21387.1 helix-turn-helix transcriptional regulator [Thermobifida halotolerans]
MICGNCGHDHTKRKCGCIPDVFWQQADVREAVARSDVTRIVRLLRARTDLTQEAIANMTGLSQGMVSQVESGKRSLRNQTKKSRALEGLGVPQVLPQESACGDTRTDVDQRSSVPMDPTSHGMSSHPCFSDPTSSAGSLGLLHCLPDTADDLVVGMLTDELRQLASAYVHHPLPPLVPRLVALRNRAFGYCRSGARPRLLQRLLLAAGASTLLLAHAAQNLGDRYAASAHLAAARRCAEYAEHDQLRSWVLGSAALFAEWLPAPDTAAQHASHSYTLMSSGHTAIRAAAVEARAFARLGDRTRALQALDRLQHADAIERTHDDFGITFGGLFTFPQAKQEFYRGSVHLLLGDTATARHHAAAALKAYRSGPAQERSYGDEALACVDLVTALLRLGDLEGAERGLSALLQLPKEKRIQQLFPALAALSQLLSQPQFRRNAHVREMRERIRCYRVLDVSMTGIALPLPQ